MNPVSRDFAPPLNLIAPFFKYGVIFYLLSMMALLFFEPTFSYQQMDVAGWIHLFLLGFVYSLIALPCSGPAFLVMLTSEARTRFIRNVKERFELIKRITAAFTILLGILFMLPFFGGPDIFAF